MTKRTSWNAGTLKTVTIQCQHCQEPRVIPAWRPLPKYCNATCYGLALRRRMRNIYEGNQGVTK